MKTIITVISIILFQDFFYGQTDKVSDLNQIPSECYIEYSENSESFQQNQTSKVSCKEITIKSIPPVTTSLTVVKIDFAGPGAYTFKIDPSLEVYQDKDVYMEDMLTGKLFDFKATSSYSFNVNRRLPDRFVLHIYKQLFRYAVSSK